LVQSERTVIPMIELTIQIDCPEDEILGAKEAIMNDLEKYGDVKIADFAEIAPKQLIL